VSFKKTSKPLTRQKTSLTFALYWSYAEVRYHWTGLEVSCLQSLCNARHKGPEWSCSCIRDWDTRYVVGPRGANTASKPSEASGWRNETPNLTASCPGAMAGDTEWGRGFEGCGASSWVASGWSYL